MSKSVAQLKKDFVVLTVRFEWLRNAKSPCCCHRTQNDIRKRAVSTGGPLSASRVTNIVA